MIVVTGPHTGTGAPAPESAQSAASPLPYGPLVSRTLPALDRAFASGVPYLVNVVTDPGDVYPRSSNLA